MYIYMYICDIIIMCTYLYVCIFYVYTVNTCTVNTCTVNTCEYYILIVVTTRSLHTCSVWHGYMF